jgi:hypothetical protein
MTTQTELPTTASPSASRLDVPPVPSGLSVAGASRRKGEARPVPVRNDDYANLTIEALREYRRALADEENKVSYWRRILQARLDVIASGSSAKELDRERLAPVLTSERVGSGRSALVEVLPADDIPPLPSLAELWDRRVGDHDEAGRLQFEQDLRDAERQLSAYRSALHKRIGEATGELIARYREQPDLCLSALPLAPVRRATA